MDPAAAAPGDTIPEKHPRRDGKRYYLHLQETRLLLLLARMALAAPSLLDQIEADAGRSATAAVACTSSQDGGRRLAQVLAIAEAIGADASSDAWNGAAALSERLAFSAQPLHGITWGGDQGFLLELGASASSAQLVEAIARATGANGTPSAVTPSTTGWTVSPPDGDPLHITSTEHGFSIAQGSAPGATGRALPAALRSAIPQDPGCLLYMHGESARTGEYHALVHLPPQGVSAPVHLALTMTTLSALDAIAFRAGAPPAVRTVEVPVGIAVLGLGIDGLDPDVLLDTREQRRAVRRLARAFPWAAGTTLAVFRPTKAGPQGGAPRVGAVVPLAKDWRASKVLARFLKVARAGGAQVLSVDATHAQVVVTQGRRTVTLHVAGAEGRLLVASDPVLLSTMEGDTGTPWISGTAAETAQRYPILVAGASADPMRPWSVAVDFPPSSITGQVTLPLDFDQLLATLEPFGALFRTNLERVQQALPQGEPTQTTAP